MSEALRRAWRVALTLLGPAMTLSLAPAAFARTAQGPSLAVEQTAPAAGQTGSSDTPTTAVGRRRYTAELLVPVPVRLLGGLVILKGDLSKERREIDLEGDESTDAHTSVAGAGLIFLPHAAEGAPRFFVVAERYGAMSFDDRAGPMSEFILGADIADDDMPWQLKLTPTDEAETRLGLRYRNFPGFHRWLFLVGHKIETVSGWSLDVTIPSHILGGWQTVDNLWKVYAGLRWSSRHHPLVDGEMRAWEEGYAETRLVGVRRQLRQPLYLALEAGMQRQQSEVFDSDGERLSEAHTRLAPWLRLALETWISTL